MKKLANSKMIAIIMATVIIVSIFSPTFNVVFAQNNVTLDFQGGRLAENGTVIYTVDGKDVPVKLVTKNNNTYEDVAITQMDNTPIDLDEHEYYLHIDRTNNSNVRIGIDGTTYDVPEDNYFGLYSNNFQGGVLLIGIQSNNPENPQNPGGQNDVVLDFQGGILENGTVVYNVNGQEVPVKLVTKDNDTNTYENVEITNMRNTPIDLSEHDYYLYIDRTNNGNVQVKINGNTYQIPGDSYFGLHANDYQSSVLGILIESNSQGGQEEPPFELYTIIARFKGNPDIDVLSDFDGNVLMPDGWTEGEVEFYARTCTVDGELKPYNEEMEMYDEGSYAELRLDVEGMINRDKINESVGVAGNMGNETQDGTQVAVVEEDFLNYGRAGFHLCRYNSPINQLLNIVTEDMIFVRAEAVLGMTYSFGSATIDNVLLTSRQEGDVSIFFGNTETLIRAEGIKVAGITNMVGGDGVVINEDGTATVTLPPLSKETTTTLTLTIELQDGTSITKTVNVRRTAIELGYDDAEGNGTLCAGYVINRDYLYNGQLHDDEIFDAYLQVILYKDGVVAGYKQVQIDDEEFVNNDDNFNNGPGGAMELHSNNRIALYGTELGDTIEGVNGASVFLTNGPIDFSSNTLPSVEFGIGSGVTIEFGGEE